MICLDEVRMPGALWYIVFKEKAVFGDLANLPKAVVLTCHPWQMLRHAITKVHISCFQAARNNRSVVKGSGCPPSSQSSLFIRDD